MYSYTNEALCQKCGGKCCKAESCFYSPEDFPVLNLQILLDLYNEGKIMFARSEMSHTWIVRPRMKNQPGMVYSLTDIGEFEMLIPDGCRYVFYHRPRGGRCLIPSDLEMCMCKYTIFDCIMDWEEYEYLLREAVINVRAEERVREGKEFSYNHSLCETCGGQCCKSTGCYFSPKDFDEITFEKMMKIISKGFISLVPISPLQTAVDVDVWVLKVRNRMANVVDFSPNDTGECILLEKTGCMLHDDDRPYGGKALVPARDEPGSCTKGYSLRQCALEWLPYQKVLQRCKEEFYEKDITFEGIL